MSRTVTIKDVAREAGVSVATVSAALGGNSYKTIHISEATRARVLDVAERLDYRRNINARDLRRRRTDIIGFFGPLYAHDPFYARIIVGLQTGCERHQKDLLLHGEFHGRAIEDMYDELAKGRVDGIVALMLPEHPLGERLAKSALPCVTIVNQTPGLPCVRADDGNGIRQAVHYLAGKGHRRIVYRRDGVYHTSELSRFDAYREMMAEYGFPEDVWVVGPEASEAEARRGLRLDAHRADRPTAVIAWHDHAAFDLVALCFRVGIQVPGDLAVVGFDGHPRPSGFTPELTSVRAPWEEVAARAVNLLAEQKEGEALPPDTVLPVELVVGDTA
jgi:LacI family transcriptional regulator